MKNTRRDFIRTASLLSVAGITGFAKAGNLLSSPAEGLYELPPLGYPFNALEPFIDAQTMMIHHGKHHMAYVTKLNEAIAKEPGLKKRTLDELVKNINMVPEGVRTAVRNNAGGHWNHSFFWPLLKKGTRPSPAMEKAFAESFGSVEEFKKEFEKAATSVFGSGWAWVIKKNNKLVITTTANQDNPLMDIAEKQGTPILGIDVWEHAYYLRYQNKRPEYLQAFWNVLNWNRVEELYQTK